MMQQAYYWENHLLDMAFQARGTLPGASDHRRYTALDKAFDHCQEITRQNSKTFYVASGFLPKPKRLAIRALYAFCRVSDDIVDASGSSDLENSPSVHAGQAPAESADGNSSSEQTIKAKAARLLSWRHRAMHDINPDGLPGKEDQVIAAWAHSRHLYAIPGGYINQLLDGLAMDMKQVRYASFQDLTVYCYGVACTVGLMSMHIVGYLSEAAFPYAIRLGVALQLTNILRDVGEDYRAGRLYLPQDELDAFGVSEDHLRAGIVDDAWRGFMRFQIDRTRHLYREALPGVSLLHPDGRFAIAAAGELYQGILDAIERNDYDVFSRRAAVSRWGKAVRLPGIWLRSNRIAVQSHPHR